MRIRNADRRRLLYPAGAAALAAALWLGCSLGPIGPLSGGHLTGQEGTWPDDWTRTADIEQAQLETRPEDPHSVNVWLVVVDGRAYLATSLLVGTETPDEREWVRNVAADPRVRLRVEGVVYPARLQVVGDPALRERIFAAYHTKYPELDPSRSSAARFFQVTRGDASGS